MVRGILLTIAIGATIPWLVNAEVSGTDTVPEDRVISIDQSTISKGLTIRSSHGKVLVAIPPKSLMQSTSSVTMNLQFDRVDEAEDREGFTRGWSVDIGVDADIVKPLTLVMKTGPLTLNPVIAEFDDMRGTWTDLPTRLRWKQQEVMTTINHAGTYALFFDTGHRVRGKATWYPDRLSKDSVFAAASNEYPLRTKLKVTNVQTNESVVVTVQSVGPFVKGRIIDLTHTAFSKIGYPRKQGVLDVLVEPVLK